METNMHGEGSHDHILGYKTYVYVCVLLLILTAVTVGVSYINFGVFNIVIALVVASLKASVVALYFMHLKFEDKVTWIFVLYPLGLLALLIGLVASDVFYRVIPYP